MKTLIATLIFLLPISTKAVFIPFMNKPVVVQTAYETKRELHLKTIRTVESNDGQNTKHALVTTGLNANSYAYGRYGLMPITIKETVRIFPKQFKHHKSIQNLTSQEVHEYMERHPGLEQKIAEAHYDRLAKIFGQKLHLISYAWFQGITKTKRDLKAGVDIKEHWHVSKTLKTRERLVANNL
jgi:hypothetical protein